MEFALVMPVLALILLMGYEITNALSVYRKVVDTTAEIASITSQQQTLTSGTAQAIMTDTSEIMKPFSNASLSITMLEVATSSSCTPGSCPTTITWEQTQTAGVAGGTDTAIGQSWTLPTSLQVASTSYILIETTYTYRPTVGSHYVGSIPLSAQLYISPREVSSIPCSTC